MKKFLLVFVILLLVIGVNVGEGALADLGVNADFLLVALIAIVIAGLISQENLGLIVMIVIAAVLANLPPEMAEQIGYDRDIVLAVLVALVLLPLVARQF